MTVSFGYTIIWVADVQRTIDFYQAAFGFTCKLLQQFGPVTWAELETGATTIAFASELETETLFPSGVHRNSASLLPAAILLSFFTDDVPQAFAQAIAAGAIALDAPKLEPWGQTVARLQDPNGVLISLASPKPS